VIVRIEPRELASLRSKLQDPLLQDSPIEGLVVRADSTGELAQISVFAAENSAPSAFVMLESGPSLSPADLEGTISRAPKTCWAFLRRFRSGDGTVLAQWIEFCRLHGAFLAAEVLPCDLPFLADALSRPGGDRLIFTLAPDFRSSTGGSSTSVHSLGCHRALAEALSALGRRDPIWIRGTAAAAVRGDNSFLSKLLEASFLAGGLLCDGIGDFLSIETEADPVRAARLAYNVLQGAGARISKAEFVACPSCGRTLFDLQTTTQRIRAQTSHLKGVKIAIMGCIVNGPGEMADADFGYVGGAPGKINLYVGKQCVQYNLPQGEADARLMALIKEHGKWAEPVGPA
jgi:(E)-4-hydroxy-3-methylbut-2-enyl-diphosphate synthase